MAIAKRRQRIDLVHRQRRKPAASTHDFDRMKLLFDYTKFHIGVYATLVSLLIGLISLGPGNLSPVQHICLAVTTVFFVLAGACGGIVASNIPNLSGMEEFNNSDLGTAWLFRERLRMKGPKWASLEHFFFWAGIFVALVGLVPNLPLPFNLDGAQYKSFQVHIDEGP